MTTPSAQALRYLTPKRAEFLKNFRTHPYISTEDAYELASAKTDSAKRGTRRFLMLLYQAGYLLRTPVFSQDVIRNPHFQYSYRLSKHGAKIVHGSFTAEKSPYSLPHDQEITTFHLRLERAYPGTVFWQQRDIKKTSVYPDALFGLSKDGKNAVYFFLEIEKSRPNHVKDGMSGLEAKLRRYDEYRDTDHCEKDWKLFRNYRVIVVVRTEERQRNLLTRLSPLLPYRFIWVTTEELYKQDIMSKIFLTPKDFTKSAYSLSEV